MTSTFKSNWIYIILIGYCVFVSIMISMVGANIWNVDSGSIQFDKIIYLIFQKSFFVEVSLLLCVFAYSHLKTKLIFTLCVVGFIVSIYTLTQSEIQQILDQDKVNQEMIIINSELNQLNQLYEKQLSINHITKSNQTMLMIQSLNQKKSTLNQAESSESVTIESLVYKSLFVIFISFVNILVFHFLIDVLLIKSKSESELNQNVNHFESSTDSNESNLIHELNELVNTHSMRKVSEFIGINYSSLRRLLNGEKELTNELDDQISKKLNSIHKQQDLLRRAQ